MNKFRIRMALILILNISLILSMGSCNRSDGRVKTLNSAPVDERVKMREESDSVRVEKAFTDWEKHLLGNKIFCYVSKEECSDFERMMNLYEQGLYPTHTYRKNHIPFETNDNRKAFIVNYYLDNCVRGTTTFNDIIIFSNGDEGKLRADTSLTNQLKSQFYKWFSERFEPDGRIYQENGFYYVNGLQVERGDSGSLSGSFEIHGNGPNCCPQFSGTFQFHLGEGRFEVLELIENEI